MNCDCLHSEPGAPVRPYPPEVHMKKATMMVCLMMLAAMPLHAYVQPGSLASAARIAPAPPSAPDPLSISKSGTTERAPIGAPLDEQPSRPIPEPGTVTMAAMGLLALGAAVRRARGRI